MELLNQKAKMIMEGCKERARGAGLVFTNDTLEYIVTNRDLLELTPKYMIPTLYDYWVHDLEVLKEKGRYELYPSNPYETVINTRPAISFYNDNNPDWMNVMIFYHVLAHIDFFQNNVFFKNTWDIDFTNQALSDKRLIARLRSEHGRWVDYIIEFARSIDNLVGYTSDLLTSGDASRTSISLVDFYFDIFLQQIKKVHTTEYLKELEKYNECVSLHKENADQVYFTDVRIKYPEFNSHYAKVSKNYKPQKPDIVQHILDHSRFLNEEKNQWMRSVLEIVRKTSLFFQPQIRTKIMNEGWASYWHEILFLQDDRIKGHEIDFARTHTMVAAMPRIGLNPYALGMRLFQYIEEQAEAGHYTKEYRRLTRCDQRAEFESTAVSGKEYIFSIRKELCDTIFINNFIDQDFMSIHDLFVTGKRLNESKMVWEYYVKSREAAQYREMLQSQLYHPPYITLADNINDDGSLYLFHHFEGKPLVQEFITGTMLGIEYLWGRPVHLETSEIIPSNQKGTNTYQKKDRDVTDKDLRWKRVVYTMEDRKLSKRDI
jgi:stage V sporulation protein R